MCICASICYGCANICINIIVLAAYICIIHGCPIFVLEICMMCKVGLCLYFVIKLWGIRCLYLCAYFHLFCIYKAINLYNCRSSDVKVSKLTYKFNFYTHWGQLFSSVFFWSRRFYPDITRLSCPDKKIYWTVWMFIKLKNKSLGQTRTLYLGKNGQ